MQLLKKFYLFSIFLFISSLIAVNVNKNILLTDYDNDISIITSDISFSSPINVTNYLDFINEGFTGNGTFENPFVLNGNIRIVGSFIDALTIINSNYYFVIQNCNFSGYNAINVINSSNGLIINNSLGNNFNSGVRIQNSTNIRVYNNDLCYNYYYGIAIRESSLIIVQNNSISDNFDGILLRDTSNNSIINNTILNNERYGIMIQDSEKNVIKDNEFYNDGLMLQGKFLNHYLQNIINNTLNDKKLVYLKNIDSSVNFTENLGNINDIGQIIIVNSSNFVIKNTKILDGGIGIFLAFSHNISISQNTLNYNIIGIAIEFCLNVTVEDNLVNSNYFSAIHLINVHSTIIRNNTCSDILLGDSIYLYNGTDVKIIDNICNMNFKTGISAFLANYLEISNNVCNENQEGGILLYFICNSSIISNVCYQNDVAGGINIQYSDHLNIINNYVAYNTVGILLYSCYDIELTNNYHESNYQALSIQKTNNATVIGNECIFNLGTGISLTNTNNSFFVNNNISYNNNFGFSISGSSNNHFESNKIYNNSNFAFYLEINDNSMLRSKNNTIINNLVFHSSYYAIYLDTETYSNKILNNTFFSYTEILTSQGYDAGFINEIDGNYWSDYDPTNDEDNDGIGDKPYYLDGGSNADFNPVITSNYDIPLSTNTNGEDSKDGYNNDVSFFGFTLLIIGLYALYIQKKFRQ